MSVLAIRMRALGQRALGRWAVRSQLLGVVHERRRGSAQRSLARWAGARRRATDARLVHQFVYRTLVRGAFSAWRRKAAQMHELRALACVYADRRMGVPRERLRMRRTRSRFSL